MCVCKQLRSYNKQFANRNSVMTQNSHLRNELIKIKNYLPTGISESYKLCSNQVLLLALKASYVWIFLMLAGRAFQALAPLQ